MLQQQYEWSRLNNLQVGRYAEYFFKMQFVLLGFDVYATEVDDRGIDFVLRREPDRYWDVQVKSLRDSRYVFFPKSKFRIRPTLLVALAIFEDGHEPDLFLIPAARWEKPDRVFVDRDYEGLKSPPEYGINVSKKAITALGEFHFTQALESIFGDKQLAPSGEP
jgi:hypothetical protein